MALTNETIDGLFKESPHLWCVTNINYYNDFMKETSIQTIANKMNLTVDAVNQKLKEFMLKEHELVSERDMYLESATDVSEANLEWEKRNEKARTNRQNSPEIEFTDTYLKTVNPKLAGFHRYTYEKYIFRVLYANYKDVDVTNLSEEMLEKVHGKLNSNFPKRPLSLIEIEGIWSVIKNCFSKYHRKVFDGENTNIDKFWDIVDSLYNLPEDKKYIENPVVVALLNVYAKEKDGILSNEKSDVILFDMISKYPCLKSMYTNKDNELKREAWDEIINAFQRKTKKFLSMKQLKCRLSHMLLQTRTKVKIFLKTIKSKNTVSKRFLTSLDKKIIKMFPSVLRLEYENIQEIANNLSELEDSPVINLTDEFDCDEIEINSDPESDPLSIDSVIFEALDFNSDEPDYINIEQSTLKKLENDFYVYGSYDTDEPYTNRYEDMLGLIIEFVYSHPLRRIFNRQQKYFGEWACSNIWKDMSDELEKFKINKEPRLLSKIWIQIYEKTLENLKEMEKNRVEKISSISWRLLLNFPDLFAESLSWEPDIVNDASMFDDAMENDDSQQSMCSEEEFILPDTNNDNTFKQVTKRTEVPANRQSANSSVPVDGSPESLELIRHQKPIILSDITEVMEMNKRLQTASVQPTVSTDNNKNDKQTVKQSNNKTDNKKRQERSDLAKIFRPQGNKCVMSYRPNPKYLLQTLPADNWIKRQKKLATIADEKPVFSEEKAYYNFLSILQKVSVATTKPPPVSKQPAGPKKPGQPRKPRKKKNVPPDNDSLSWRQKTVRKSKTAPTLASDSASSSENDSGDESWLKAYTNGPIAKVYRSLRSNRESNESEVNIECETVTSDSEEVSIVTPVSQKDKGESTSILKGILCRSNSETQSDIQIDPNKEAEPPESCLPIIESYGYFVPITLDTTSDVGICPTQENVTFYASEPAAEEPSTQVDPPCEPSPSDRGHVDLRSYYSSMAEDLFDDSEMCEENESQESLEHSQSETMGNKVVSVNPSDISVPPSEHCIESAPLNLDPAIVPLDPNDVIDLEEQSKLKSDLKIKKKYIIVKRIKLIKKVKAPKKAKVRTTTVVTPDGHSITVHKKRSLSVPIELSDSESEDDVPLSSLAKKTKLANSNTDEEVLENI